jgi:flagellar motor switch protein FliM
MDPISSEEGITAPPQNAQTKKVVPFDVQQSTALSLAQVRSISTLHDTFAEQVSQSLARLLRASVEVKFVSAELVPYGEFLAQLPQLTFLASLRTHLPDACAILQVDLSAALSMVDLVLGGSGKDQTEMRDLTEIEDEIFGSVTQNVCHELQAAWLPVLDLNFQLDQRVPQTEASSLMPASEKTLVLSFEIRLQDVQGQLKVALPAVVCAAVLRKLTVQPIVSETVTSQKNRARLQEHLLSSSFRMELTLPLSPVSVRELLRLEPGGILRLEPRASEPICLGVAGRTMFLASPVRCGSQRGAQVKKVLSIVPKQGKETK